MIIDNSFDVINRKRYAFSSSIQQLYSRPQKVVAQPQPLIRPTPPTIITEPPPIITEPPPIITEPPELIEEEVPEEPPVEPVEDRPPLVIFRTTLPPIVNEDDNLVISKLDVLFYWET